MDRGAFFSGGQKGGGGGGDAFTPFAPPPVTPLNILFSNFILELTKLSAYKVSCKTENLLNFSLRILYLRNFSLDIP